MAKLAIPTDDGKTVASHFGRAQYFMLVEIDGDKEISRKLVENLHARGHHGEHGEHHGHGGHGNGHGHDEVFMSTGDIEGVIAVRIGPHMFEDLKARNIRVYLVSVGKSIENAINSFIEGKLRNILR